MEKREILCLLLSMALFYSLFPSIAEAAVSSKISILSQGSIIYKVMPTNLAPLPDAWSLICYASKPDVTQYAFVDYTVTYNGHPSIRLDQGGGYDIIYPTLLDRSIWLKQRYAAKAGDHVIFKIWIKMPYNPRYPDYQWLGGRAGIDGYRNGVNIAPDGEVWHTPYVKWGSDWTQVVLDFVIPSSYTLDHILPWIQVRPGEDPLSGWFAESEFYINP